MEQIQDLRSFRHFSRHLFFASKIHVERRKAEQDIFDHLQRMRKSIIRMNLSYTDVDKLKKKVDNLIEWERKYAKFFKPEDRETTSLKNQITALEQELKNEREEKMSIISENNEKISQLTGSLDNLKSQMKHLHLEKAKRQQRLTALDKKIREKVDVHDYYHS